MTRKAIIAVGIGALVMAGNAVAAPTNAQKCSASLRKCIGKLVQGCATCYAKKALTGADATQCIAVADAKFEKCQVKNIDKYPPDGTDNGCASDNAGIDHLQNDDVLNAWCVDIEDDLPSTTAP